MSRLRRLPLLGIGLIALLGGCATMGPTTIPRDRFDFVMIR
jgi:hypothetical protein